MNDLTLITCSYNSLALMKNWYFSIKNVFAEVPNIIVCENSDDAGEQGRIMTFMLDNNIPFIQNATDDKTHAHGVRMIIPFIKTKYALLLDTDVEMLKEPSDVIHKMDEHQDIALGGFYGKRLPNYVNRVHPWFMVMNVPIVRKANLFFNGENSEENRRMFSPLFTKNKLNKYDVGCRFCEEAEFRGYKILTLNKLCKDCNNGPWFRHHEGLSWCKRRENDPLLKRRRGILKEIENKNE